MAPVTPRVKKDSKFIPVNHDPAPLLSDELLKKFPESLQKAITGNLTEVKIGKEIIKEVRVQVPRNKVDALIASTYNKHREPLIRLDTESNDKVIKFDISISELIHCYVDNAEKKKRVGRPPTTRYTHEPIGERFSYRTLVLRNRTITFLNK